MRRPNTFRIRNPNHILHRARFPIFQTLQSLLHAPQPPRPDLIRMPLEIAHLQASREVSKEHHGELLIPRLHARLLLPGIWVRSDVRGTCEK